MKRLTISLAFVTLSGIFVLGFALDSFFHEFNNSNDEDEYLPYRQVISQLAQTLDQDIDEAAFIAQWQGINKQAISISPLHTFPLPTEIKSAFTSGEALLLESSASLSLNVFMPNKQSVLSVEVQKPVENNSMFPLKLFLSSLFYLGVLICVIIWVFPLVRQLNNLKKATNKVGNGNFDVRIKAQRTSYITNIESAFNQMAKKIEILIEDKKLLTSAVSHDLKTPIARLRFGVEALEETKDPVRITKYIQRLNDDVTEMEALINVLLTYAKLDQSMDKMKKCQCDAVALIKRAIAKSKHAVEFQDIKIGIETNAPTSIDAEHDLLQMALVNIINNAIEHAKSRVIIKLSNNNNRLQISIIDDGAGIADQDTKALFKPFSRGKSKRDYSGHGMGLAIVDRICHWHNASLVMKNNKEVGGAEVQICF